MSTKVVIVGFGAIGRALVARALQLPALSITHVVVKPSRVQETQVELAGCVEAEAAATLLKDFFKARR